MNHALATLVSRVFEPALTLGIALFVGSQRLGLSLLETIFWLCVLLGPIIGFRVWARYKLGLDWDIKDRHRRVKPFAMLLVLLVIDCVLVSVWEPRLLSLLITLLVWAAGFFAATAWWTKISGHTAGNALATGLVIRWFGWEFWPILLIVPIVGWARVVRRDHTPLQTVIGAVYSWVLLMFI